MKLIYYKSQQGNIGDDLNVWLWKKIFGDDFFNKNEEVAFLGIGSILLENSDYLKEASKFKKKIIFGSGVRSINEKFHFDDSWEFFFTRGPFSSLKTTYVSENYITDSAYFLALTQEYKKFINQPKKYNISYIPYYASVDKVDWKVICDELGWNLILPTGNNVEKFIAQVAASEMIISEAMHGAIIADILRIPWKRSRYYSHIFEGEMVSEFKWNDWLYSIDVFENNYINCIKKPKKLKHKIVNSGYYNKKNQNRILATLKKHERIPFNLSSDTRFNEIVKDLKLKKNKLIDTYLQ